MSLVELPPGGVGGTGLVSGGNDHYITVWRPAQVSANTTTGRASHFPHY